MTLPKQNAGQPIARIHADSFLAASARQMYDANLETVSKDIRISCAFVEAIDWAGRVRDAVLKHQATKVAG